MNKLFTLLAFLNGDVYVQGRHMTFGQCVDRKIHEVNAVALVADSGHIFDYEFRCVYDDSPLVPIIHQPRTVKEH